MVRTGVSYSLVFLGLLIGAEPCLAKEYAVKEGDAISTVLERFAPSEGDLREANPQKRDWPNLRVGERLEIPHLSFTEVRALEVQHSTIQNELSIAHESIVALTEARDLARSESALWQSKFETTEPVATSAWFWKKVYFIFLGVSVVLGSLLAVTSFIAVTSRKRLGAQIVVLEDKVKALEGDPDGWRRMTAKLQDYLSRLGRLSKEDRDNLLALLIRIEALPVAAQQSMIADFIRERLQVSRSTTSQPTLSAVPSKK